LDKALSIKLSSPRIRPSHVPLWKSSLLVSPIPSETKLAYPLRAFWTSEENIDIQLIVKVHEHAADMLFEVFRHFTDMTSEKLIDLIDIFCVHNVTAGVKNEGRFPVFIALLLSNVNGFSD